MTTAVIVQARMSSTRLPGKVMAELAGRPVLAHVIERCKAIKGADFVGLAVPDRADSNGMTELARSMGIDELKDALRWHS